MRSAPSAWTAVVVFIATDIVIVAFWSVPLGHWSTDEAGDYLHFYAPVARQLLEGRGLVTSNGSVALDYPPGFPSILSVLFRFAQWTGTSDAVWLQGFTLGALGLTSCLLYWLAQGMFGNRRAVLTATLWITCPFQLWVSKQPNSEIAFLPLLYGAFVAYVWLLKRDGSYKSLGCGVVCGLAALVRPIVLFLPIVFAIGLFLTKSISRMRLFGYSALIVTGFALVILPWELWVRTRTGTVILVSASLPRAIVDGLTFAVGRRDFRATIEIPTGVRTIMEDVAERSRRGELSQLSAVFSLIRDKFLEDPLSMSHLFAWKATRAWYGTDAIRPIEKYALIVQVCYLALTVAGAYTLLREPGFGRQWIIVAGLIVLYFWAMTTIVLSIVRYMTPAIGLLFPIAAAALEKVGERLNVVVRRPSPERSRT
jgi:4-amino-4-deoxy-L-arabinose transferase-like glycosyltransferase